MITRCRSPHLGFMRRGVVVGLLTFAWMLGGCATPWSSPAQTSAQQSLAQAERETQDAQHGAQQRFQGRAGVIWANHPLLLGKEVPLQTPVLPTSFEQHVTFRSMGSQTLPEIMASLSTLIGMRLDWMEVLREEHSGPSGTGTGAASGESNSDLDRGWPRQRLAYEFSGPLTRLLDDLASRIDASWRYDEALGRVVFYRYEQAVIGVSITPGSKSVQSSISIGGSGGGTSGGSGASSAGSASAGGGSSVSISSSLDIDPWRSLMEGIGVLLGRAPSGASTSGAGSANTGGEMVSGRHGYAVANRDLAQLIVVARPSVLAQIRQYVNQTNRRFAKNILIDVRVIEIQDNQGENVAMSTSGLIQKISSSGVFQGLGLTIGPSSIGTGGIQSVQLSANAIPGGKAQVTLDAIVGAMQSVAKTTVRNQGQIVAINGQPASFQQANQITYLSRVQTTNTVNVGTQTSREPGTVTVGFTANFIPTIMTDGRIMLQYQIQSSNLVGLKTVGDDRSFIQVPEIFSQSLQQQAYMRDGEILMLFGFGRDRAENSESREFLGFGRNHSANRSLTAVIIQVRSDSSV